MRSFAVRDFSVVVAHSIRSVRAWTMLASLLVLSGGLIAVSALTQPAAASEGTAFTNADGSPCNGQAFMVKENPAAERSITKLDLGTGEQGESTAIANGVSFNAVGFNDADGQIYGTYRVGTGGPSEGGPAEVNGTIWRISADGSYEQVALSGTDVVAPSAENNDLGSLPNMTAPSYPIGDFDEDGYYWVAARQSAPGGGYRTGPMYKIEITPGTASTPPSGVVVEVVEPDANVGLSDFTYVEGTDSFWGVSDSPARSLVSISRSGVVTNHGEIADIPAAQYIGMFVDTNLNIYALEIGTGDVYAINRTDAVDNGAPLAATLTTNIGTIGNGDAAQCGFIEPLPGVQFGKTVDKETAVHGDTLTYTVTVSNIGLADLADVAVTDTLPEGTTYVEGSASDGGTHADGVVSWTIPLLARGETVTLTLQATIDAGFEAETLVNRVSVVPPNIPPGTPPPVVDNPCEDDPTQSCAETTVPGVPALQFGKVVDQQTAQPGDTLTYTLTLANTGAATATNVAVSDTLPEGTTFVSADADGTHADGVVSWNVAELAAGASVQFTVVVTIDADTEPGTLLNRMSVTPPPGTPPPGVDNPCEDDPTQSCAETTVPPEVTPPTPPTEPTEPTPVVTTPTEPVAKGPLAMTGTDARLLGAIALGALVVGGLMLAAGRRRHREN